MRLDRQGGRGLLADLTMAGSLTRQAAFILAAAILARGEAAVLDAVPARLGIAEGGAGGIGLALRTRRARDVIAAVYDLDPSAVPGGFLRALARVQGDRGGPIGLGPLGEPETYERLFALFAGEGSDEAVTALRYCGPLSSAQIRAVDALDPVLLHPEVVRTMCAPEPAILPS